MRNRDQRIVISGQSAQQAQQGWAETAFAKTGIQYELGRVLFDQFHRWNVQVWHRHLGPIINEIKGMQEFHITATAEFKQSAHCVQSIIRHHVSAEIFQNFIPLPMG
jgi:hypothetical protein